MSDEIVEGKVEIVRLGAIEATSPNDVVVRATGMAKTLADIITSRKLYTTINGKKYVQVEGWSTLGAMMGVLPREVEVYERENGDFEATVELIRTSDCEVVGRASSIVSGDEKLWKGRERYARRSMAVTRATGKAYRLGFSWIMSLAGYEPTPAEEMPVEEVRPVKRATLPQPEQSDPVTDLLVEKFATDAPKNNGNKYARPMSPEVLKEALQVKKAKSNPATEKQTNLVRILLLEHFADREDERHQAQEYLTGHKSFKDIEPEMISAILDWMKPEKSTDGSGAYVLGKDAKVELTMVARKFMEEHGQQQLNI